MKKIKEFLDFLKTNNLYPHMHTISTSSIPEQIIDGKKVISFCSNNYLGLAYSPKLINAAIEAGKKYGAGSSGSRWISGNLEIFEEMERKIAEFKKSEAAIVFGAGYMANVGTISAVVNLPSLTPFPWLKEKTIIFSDELNHASIIDGCKLSRAPVIVYRHCDIKDLENKIRKYKKTRKIIVTDGVFSMDGDIAPLPDIVKLAKKYEALVMTDDAHATGVLGKTGGGTAEYFGLENDIDIKMGTLSKAVGVCGGYVAGKKELIEYLRVSARSYIFATAFSPMCAGAIIASINEIINGGSLRLRLKENADMLRDGLKSLGFNTLTSQTQIIPVLIGKEEKAIKIAELLFENGFYAPCVRWPAVEKNKSRIRFTVMSRHTKEQVKNLLLIFKKVAYKI